jgi:hypothetical protein
MEAEQCQPKRQNPLLVQFLNNQHNQQQMSNSSPIFPHQIIPQLPQHPPSGLSPGPSAFEMQAPLQTEKVLKHSHTLPCMQIGNPYTASPAAHNPSPLTYPSRQLPIPPQLFTPPFHHQHSPPLNMHLFNSPQFPTSQFSQHPPHPIHFQNCLQSIGSTRSSISTNSSNSSFPQFHPYLPINTLPMQFYSPQIASISNTFSPQTFPASHSTSASASNSANPSAAGSVRRPLANNVGLYSPMERRNKILKYKNKQSKWRSNHPISRIFNGRKKVAEQKNRYKGRFVKSSVLAEFRKGDIVIERLNAVRERDEENLKEEENFITKKKVRDNFYDEQERKEEKEEEDENMDKSCIKMKITNKTTAE